MLLTSNRTTRCTDHVMNTLQTILTALSYSAALVVIVSTGAEPGQKVPQHPEIAENRAVVEWICDEYLEPGICEML